MVMAKIVKLLNYSCPHARIGNRLYSYVRRQIKTNPVSEDLVFDDIQWRLLLKYARYDKEEFIKQTTSLLYHLEDEEGRFCKSHYNYLSMLDKCKKFTEEEAPSFTWNEHFQMAVSAVKEQLRQAHLQMLQYDKDSDVIAAVQHWDTSAGFTAWEFGLSRTKKEDVLERTPSILRWYREKEVQAKVLGTFNVPRTVASRTQASLKYDEEGSVTGFKRSTRAVVIDPLELIIPGSQFVRPAIDWLSSSFSGFAIGKDDQWINQWVIKQKLRGCSFMSLDYSAYDSTIPSWLLHTCFDVMRAMFDDHNFDDRLWKVVEHDFIHKFVLITRDSGETLGEWWHHGTTSGSSFTTVINCIANMIITETWKRKFQADVEAYNIMGDDNLIAYHEHFRQVNWEEVALYISHNFGIQVNHAKSGYTKAGGNPEYLSRVWTPMGCDRALVDVIAILLYPEKFRNYKQISNPMVVMWSYILAYPLAMRQLIDVDAFLRDCNLSYFSSKLWSKEELTQLPYNIRTVLESAGQSAKFSLSRIATLQRS